MRVMGVAQLMQLTDSPQCRPALQLTASPPVPRQSCRLPPGGAQPLLHFRQAVVGRGFPEAAHNINNAINDHIISADSKQPCFQIVVAGQPNSLCPTKGDGGGTHCRDARCLSLQSGHLLRLSLRPLRCLRRSPPQPLALLQQGLPLPRRLLCSLLQPSEGGKGEKYKSTFNTPTASSFNRDLCRHHLLSNHSEEFHCRLSLTQQRGFAVRVLSAGLLYALSAYYQVDTMQIKSTHTDMQYKLIKKT